jgi:hypothetical protein
MANFKSIELDLDALGKSNVHFDLGPQFEQANVNLGRTTEIIEEIDTIKQSSYEVKRLVSEISKACEKAQKEVSNAYYQAMYKFGTTIKEEFYTQGFKDGIAEANKLSSRLGFFKWKSKKKRDKHDK